MKARKLAAEMRQLAKKKKPDPVKTRKAYKLFVEGKDKELYPLFVDAKNKVPQGEFLEANFPDVAFTAPAAYSEEDVAAGGSLPVNVRVQKYGQAIVNTTTGILEVYVDLTYPGEDGYQALSAASTPVVFGYAYRTYSFC